MTLFDLMSDLSFVFTFRKLPFFPLQVSLTARNACLLLSQSRLFEEPELMTRCWEVIDAQAEMALQSDGFVDIDYPTLISVLSRETLNCREIVLFEAALNWAEAECERQGLQSTPANKRKVCTWSLIIKIKTREVTNVSIAIFRFNHKSFSSKKKLRGKNCLLIRHFQTKRNYEEKLPLNSSFSSKKKLRGNFYS